MPLTRSRLVHHCGVGGIFDCKAITERVQESHRVGARIDEACVIDGAADVVGRAVARMDEADKHAWACDAHSHILQRVIAKQPLDLLQRFS